MTESEEELKSPLMRVKEESEKAGLKLNVQKTKIQSHRFIANKRGKSGSSDRFYFPGLQNHYGHDCSRELEMEELGLEPSVRQDFLSAQWLSMSNQGWGLSPSCWIWHPEGWAQAGSVPFQRVFPSICTGTFALERGSAEVSGAYEGSLLTLSADGGPSYLWHTAWEGTYKCLLFSAQTQPDVQVPLCPSQHITVLSLHHFRPFVKPHHWATWTPGTRLRMSCGRAAAVRDLRAAWDVLLE